MSIGAAAVALFATFAAGYLAGRRGARDTIDAARHSWRSYGYMMAQRDAATGRDFDPVTWADRPPPLSPTARAIQAAADDPTLTTTRRPA